MPKWRSGSEFGDGRRVPLDREQRAVFLAKLKLARRPGRLTLAAVEIGRILVNKLGADGRLDPCIDTLARLACVDPSTVVRALARLKELGFVTWTRRLVRGATSDWQCRQTSNAYVLAVPGACDVHFAKQVVSKSYKKEAQEQRMPTPQPVVGTVQGALGGSLEAALASFRKAMEEDALRKRQGTG